jgi:plasmid maintenance system antidote protein VapI
MRKKISKEQLKYLSDDLRDIIKDYMKQHDLTVYGFATLTKIQTNQMHLFLTEQRGLNLTTVERIAKIIS